MSKTLGQQVLADAIALLEDERAWVQKKGQTLREFNGKAIVAFCPDEAIVQAAKRNNVVHFGTAANAARTLMYRHGGWVHEPSSIHTWNDAEGRTHAEVLAFMHGALAA